MNALIHVPVLGTFVPIMGSKSPDMGTPAAPRSPGSLADALFSTSQQRVLGLLFGQPDRSFYARELIKLAAGGTGAVQRELARLERSGLVLASRVGSQKHYRANPDSPLFDELSSIARKTMGLAEPLREALEPFASAIRAAFVYGSVAKRSDTATSDIDLMIVSDTLDYASAMDAIHPLNQKLGRQVSPTIFKEAEFARRLRDGSAFVARVREQPKLWIIGGEHDLPAG